MEWSTACVDWKERLRQGQSIIPAPLFSDQAEHAVNIFKQLKIVDAPGSPTFGDACDQWVFDLVASIFGAYDARPDSPTEGRRLITEWFILIPKKNSKSTIAAGIMMTALILNWRMSGEFTILAPTLEVAANSFAPSRDMVKHEPDLDALMQVQTHIKTITHRGTSATLKVIAADPNTTAGKKSVGTLVDEIWLFGKQANAENMLREAIGGLMSRPEGFVIYLTTQSDEPPAGVFRQKLQYARDVRDGKIKDPRFVPVLYEFPEEMIESGDHLRPENFHIVNPNLGFSVDEETLQREFNKAQIGGEESLRGFLSKHLNVEIGLNLRSDRWAGADWWEQQGQLEVTFSLPDLIERSEVVTMGGDGGGLDDLLGQYAIGRCKTTRRWLGWAHAWAHPSVLERRKAIASKLQDFARDGHLTLVTRIGEDVDQFAANVAMVYKAGLLYKMGIDPSGIGGILDAMQQAGIPEDRIIGISQGWKLNGPIKTAERKLAEGVFVHCAQPLMAWCVGNAKIVPSGNAIIITKQASGTGKIDPLMAMFNAVELMSLNPEPMTKKLKKGFVSL